MTALYLFGALIVFILMGIPVAFSIGLAGLVTLFLVNNHVSLTIIPSQLFSGMDSFNLMAIPFFILAGEVMNRAGLTIRIINLAESLVGHIRGGLAQVNILASMLMAGISGSGAADTAAIGTMMIPAMQKKNYGTDFSVVLTAVASTVGPIIPPSVLFIIYGFLTNVSIGKLFLGGVIPGVMLSVGLMIVTHFVCKHRGYQQVKQDFSMKRVAVASKQGAAAIIIPIIIIGSILSGIATATESGVIAVFVALVLGKFVYKTLTGWNAIRETVQGSVHTTAIIFMLLATSAIFSNVLIRVNFQDMVINTLHMVASTPFGMLVAIIIFILILGLFVDVTPILIMFATPLAVVGEQLGYDPVFFGVVIVISAMIGSVHPPVGGLLFISCSIGKIRITQTFKILIPFLLTLFAVLFLIILFPGVVTFLPSLLMK